MATLLTCQTKKKKPKPVAKKNGYDFSVPTFLIGLTGVDLSKIPGINESALEFLAEVGTDMAKWKSYKHFCGWLNLVPNSKISGGKLLSSKRMKKKNKAGQILKQAASTLSNNKTALGDYYRKKRARLGGKGAVTATAHKLGRIIYTMLLNKTEYSQEMVASSQQKSKDRKIKQLEQQLARLKSA